MILSDSDSVTADAELPSSTTSSSTFLFFELPSIFSSSTESRISAQVLGETSSFQSNCEISPFLVSLSLPFFDDEGGRWCRGGGRRRWEGKVGVFPRASTERLSTV